MRFLALLVPLLLLCGAARADDQPATLFFGSCLTAQPAVPLSASGTIYSQDAVDDQRGVTSYTIPGSDNCKTLLLSAAVPVSVTLPASLLTGIPPLLGTLPAAGSGLMIHNSGTSKVTVAPGQLASTVATTGSPTTQIALTVVVGSVQTGNVLTGNACVSAGTHITGQLSGTAGQSGTYTTDLATSCSGAAVQIYAGLINGGTSLVIPPGLDCHLVADANLNFQAGQCDALMVSPNGGIFGYAASIPGGMQTVQPGFKNNILGSDILGNATYWTATGLSSPSTTSAPDGSATAASYTIGTGASESLTNATAVGTGRTFLGGVYTGQNSALLPYMYLTIGNAAGTNTATAWFDVSNCLVLSHTSTGTAGFHAAYASPIGTTASGTSAVCYIAINATVNSSNSTALLTIGVTSADATTTWSGGSGQTTSALWGADLISNIGLSGTLPANMSVPPPHVPTVAASVTVAGGVLNNGAQIANRVMFTQPTAPTVSCNGTGTAALTSGINSSDASGSLTTNTGATSCTVTFAGSPVAWSSAPVCMVQAETASAVPTSTETTSAIAITLSASVTSVVVKWQCQATIN